MTSLRQGQLGSSVESMNEEGYLIRYSSNKTDFNDVNSKRASMREGQ